MCPIDQTHKTMFLMFPATNIAQISQLCLT